MNAEEHGSLLVSWVGGLQFETDIGGGVRQRVETDGAGFVTIPWGPGPVAAGSPGGLPPDLQPAQIEVETGGAHVARRAG